MFVGPSGKKRSRQGLRPGKGGLKLFGPGPASRPAQDDPLAGAADPSGNMEESLAKPFRSGLGERPGEAESFGPGQQVLTDQGDLGPGLVRREASEGKA